MLDENIPHRVLRALQGKGYTAYRLADVGLRGKSDTEIFAYVRRRNLILITHDTDFANRERFSPPHAGILILRGFFKGSSTLDRVDAILNALVLLKGRSLVNEVYFVTRDTVQKL